MKNNSRFLELINARRAQQGRKGLRRRAPRWLYPVAIERQYTNYLLKRSAEMEEQIKSMLIERLPGLLAQATVTLDMRADDFVDDINQIMRALAVTGASIYQSAEQAATVAGVSVATFNAQQYSKIINATLGVNPLINNNGLQGRLKLFTTQNVTLIRSIPETLLKDVEGVVTRGLANSETVQTMTAEIQQRFKVSRNRARLIARDQTGKLNAQLTEERQVNAEIDEYIWNSALDERVRNSHKVMDGKICRWDNPSVYKNPNGEKWLSRSSIGGYIGTPGSDYQCRCFAEPILDDFIDTA